MTSTRAETYTNAAARLAVMLAEPERFVPWLGLTTAERMAEFTAGWWLAWRGGVKR